MARNYWNTIKADFFPTKPRPESIPKLNSKKQVIDPPKDPWWVNSKEDHYCFWTFLKRHSGPDGRFEPLMQSEIASYLGYSNSKIHFLVKEALDELKLLILEDEDLKAFISSERE